MKYIVCLLVSMLFVLNASAESRGFDVMTKTVVPLENNATVLLVDLTKKNCEFIGVTKEEQRTDSGLLERLMYGDKKYSLEITKFSCDQTVYSIKPLHIELNRSMDVGHIIRLPYIEEIRGAEEK